MVPFATFTSRTGMCSLESYETSIKLCVLPESKRITNPSFSILPLTLMVPGVGLPMRAYKVISASSPRLSCSTASAYNSPFNSVITLVQF